jgi:hypothetical protein
LWEGNESNGLVCLQLHPLLVLLVLEIINGVPKVLPPPYLASTKKKHHLTTIKLSLPIFTTKKISLVA